MFTRVQWAKDLCTGLGNTNPSPRILAFIVGWSDFETNTNSGARFNLLNTTQPGIEGATNFNSVGVKNFPNYQSGIAATVETLKNGYYPTLVEALTENIEADINDNPPQEILSELHTWSGNPEGYGEGLVTLGSGHLNDAFEYGTSPYDHSPTAFIPTDTQLDEAKNRWNSYRQDCPINTGIYNSWVNLWCQQLKYMGPPIEQETGGHDWNNNKIVYQVFAHATCEWDGQNAHWYGPYGKINS